MLRKQYCAEPLRVKERTEEKHLEIGIKFMEKVILTRVLKDGKAFNM